MKKLFKCLFVVGTMCTLMGCNNGPKDNGIKVTHNTEFDCIDINITHSELDEKGFAFGDSVDFVFSNGKELKDVPYYDGYYCKKGDYVFCMYPTYTYPVLTHEFEDDLFVAYGL